MRNYINIFIFLLATLATAQNAQRKVISIQNNPISIKTNDGEYRIVFYNQNVVETSFIPTGESFNPESHAVVLKPQSLQIDLVESANVTEYKTAGISVSIQKSPFKIDYYYKGKELLSEKTSYIKKDSTEIIDFNLTPDEVLYGGGARVLGMNRRGNRLQLYNRAHYGYETRSELMNFTMPIVLSSKMYAVHFDNAPIGYLDLDSQKNNTLAYETISGRKTYQVIAGDSWINLIENYTELTGRQPLPPRWAFGNFASRFGYHTEKETRETVAKFRAEKIPLDAIILDLYWFGKDIKGTMGNLEFDRESFPTPEKMISDLRNDGVKTILITEPFVLTTSTKWSEAVAKNVLATDKSGKPFTYDFYFGNTGLIDIFKSEGKDWFWNIYKNLVTMGVAGTWGDLGEPEVHPKDLQHATGSADELHNIYGHNWAKLVFDGYKKDFPSQRPFILMRSGYSGSQRFGMIPWSGDVNRTWGGLSGQTEISLQMGMQGMGYMHSDLGGFAGANLDNELYVRWLQYGVFQPIFRPHAQEDVASEPVFRDDKTKALAKKAIELRYKMLPYNYNIAFENHLNGTPLMRPLFFEEPDNAKAQTTSDEYLWGNDFLVSPIITAGLAEKEVYFPKSSNWYDFYSDQKFNGGSTHTIATAENHIPVFVRGGAFIPIAKPMQSTEEYSLQSFDLHFYFDQTKTESEGKLYNDDGTTPDAFEKGLFEIITFKSSLNGNDLSIRIDTDNAKLPESDKEILLIIHNVSAKPKKVTFGIEKIKAKWDRKSKTLEVKTHCKNDQPSEIRIKLSRL